MRNLRKFRNRRKKPFERSLINYLFFNVFLCLIGGKNPPNAYFFKFSIKMNQKNSTKIKKNGSNHRQNNRISPLVEAFLCKNAIKNGLLSAQNPSSMFLATLKSFIHPIRYSFSSVF